MKHTAQSHASSRHFGFIPEKFRPSRLWSKISEIHGGQDEATPPARSRRSFGLEAIEPRVLLSADISPDAEAALTAGIDQFGQTIEQFLAAEDLLDSTRLPFILQVQKADSGDQKQVAPTLGSLFSLQVDTNADGDLADAGEGQLLAWDTSGNADGTVDAGEFVQGLLFDKATSEGFTAWLALEPPGTERTTAAFAQFLSELDTIQYVFAQPGDPSVTVQLTVNSATDLTDPTDPAADLMFGLDFKLTVEQDLAIDLGTEADALKLLMYTGEYDDKKAPTIPVVSTLDLDFTFGVRVSGQESTGQVLDKYDFFVRKMDEMSITAKSDVAAGDDIDGDPFNGIDFNLNIGFLGATVNNATIDYEATVNTLLVDPDSPEVLGFTTGQYGVEQTSGVVIATNALTSEDLAHGAGFVLRIGNAGIATQVNIAADENADFAGLLVDINGALAGVGLGGLVTASFASDKLVFTLVGTTDTPLGFANESYNAGGTLIATPDGDGANIYEFNSTQSFLLSVDGVLPKLVAVRFPDPALSDIGFGATQAAALPDLVGQNAANATGTLSETFTVEILGTEVEVTDTTANFTLQIAKSDGTIVTGAVSVTESLLTPNTNTTVAQLVADINNALQTAGLGTLVTAAVSGDRIALYRVDGAVSAIAVTAADLLTQNDIGFVTGQKTTLAITAVNPVLNPDFDDDNAATNDNAHIGITVTTWSGSEAVVDTRTLLVFAGSSDADALASAIDTALANAGYAIDASLVAGKVVLTARDASVLAFSINTINDSIDELVGDVNRALVQAGLAGKVVASADGTNLRLATSGGESLEITHTLTLDAGVTFKELEDNDAAALFLPEADDASNISFKLPIDVIDGLGYDPANVAIVGNFSPFGELLITPPVPPAKPVATIVDTDDRFDLYFSYTPDIEHQDTADPDVFPFALNEEIRLVNMAEPLNFNLITAESMVGLIMGMGSALQQIANSGTFSGYDIPFADAALADLLNYTDDDKLVFSGLIDTQLIYDTGGTGIDEPGGTADDANKLLQRIVDINDPLNLDDDVAYVIPAFVTAQQLATRLDYILAGMTATGVNGINAHYEPLFTLRANAAAPSDGKLSGDASFSLVIDAGTPTAINVAKTDTDGNTSVADLAADIQAALTSAGVTDIIAKAVDGRIVLQALPGVYIKSFGVTGINAVARDQLGFLSGQMARANELTYDLDLVSSGRTMDADPTTVEIDRYEAAFEYDVDLGYFVKPTINQADPELVTLQGYTGLSLTFGIDLSPPGTVIYDVTKLAELNGGDGLNIKLDAALTGTTGVRTVLSGNADIHIDIDTNSDPSNFEHSDWITVLASDTTNNTTIQDFATDINLAISRVASLSGKVVAGVSDGRLALYAVNPGETLRVHASSAKDANGKLINPAWTELGFSTYYTSGSSVMAVKAPTPATGRLTGDATFTIEIDSKSYLVTVTDEMTAGNKTMADLVADVDNALAVAVRFSDTVDLREFIKAGFDSTASGGQRLVLTGLDGTTFTVSDVSLIAQSQLGLPQGPTLANSDDFVIHDSSGGVYSIDLDDLATNADATIADLIAHINAVASTAKTELGLGESQTAVLPELVAGNAPTAFVLTSDVTFVIDVRLDDGSLLPGSVILTIANTAGNLSYDDLVDDINTLIASDSPAISPYVHAEYDGSRIKFVTDPSVTSIRLHAVSGSLAEIGFADDQSSTQTVTAIDPAASGFALTSDARFYLALTDLGGEHEIGVTLPAGDYGTSTALAAAIDAAIDAALPNKLNVTVDASGRIVLRAIDDSVLDFSLSTKTVTAGFNATQTGLRLVDHTGGTGQFRVETINGSGAVITLGLFSTGNQGTQNQFGNGDPYRIEGGQIGLTQLDERFFVRDAQMWGAVELQTPEQTLEHPVAGVPGTALFGIVGVDTTLTGSLSAVFTAAIKDPLTGLAGGTATLLQLFEGAKQGRLTEDASFSVQFGSDPATMVTIAQGDTVANNTLADLVADINKAFYDKGIGDDILARVSGTRIEFVSRVDDQPLTVLNEAKFKITAGIGAAQIGLAGMLSSSSNLLGEQVIAAQSASRYAVDEVVVGKLSELKYDVQLNGFEEFKVGSILYGSTSGARAVVLAVADSGTTGTLTLGSISGAFDNDEVVYQQFGPMTFAAAFANGVPTSKASFGDFNLAVHVQDEFAAMDGVGTPTGFGDGFATLLDGQNYDVRFNITDFGNPYDPAAPEATFVDLAADTGDLYAFRNLDYADIGAALHDLLAVLNDVNANFDLLTVDLPGINKSISDLLSLVDGFERGVANMDDAFFVAQDALKPGVDLPALRLQDIPRALRGAFGLPEGVTPADDALDFVELDFDKTNGMLLVELNLHESLDTKLGLDINVGSGLPNLTSAGVLKVNGTLDVDLKFGIDLADTSKAYLFDDSSIAADLHVEGEGQTYETADPLDTDKAGMGLVFRASIGPLAVFIQDGDALIDAAFALPALNFGAGVHKKLIGEVNFEDFEAPDITENNADIVLPMFYGGEGPNDYIGDFRAIGKLVDDPSTNAVVEGPPLVTIPDKFEEIRDDIAAGDIDYDPFDNILLGLDTLNLYLELLSDDLAGDVLGVNLPFIGDQMADILFIENFRDTLYSTLKNGIANDINPTAEDITSLLTDALGSSVSNIHYHSDLVSADIADWYHQWDFTVSDSETIWLSDFVLGIPGLDFDVDTAVKVEFSWSIDIGFGVNFVEGAYIDLDLSDNVYDDPFTFDGDDVQLGLTITLEDGTHTGSLGFLQVQVSEDGPEGKEDNLSEPETLDNPQTIDKQSGAKVDFNVEVAGASTARLGFADMGKLDAFAELYGRALDGSSNILTLHLNGEIAGVGVLPRVSTNLEVDWIVQGSVAGTGIKLSELTHDDPVLAGLDRIAYTGMSMDGGSIVTDFLDPIFGKINEIIQPFMPVVDVLSAPIPVLSDLAGEPFTLLDLAEIFGSVDTDFIEAVADILTLIDKFTDPGELPIDMPLGSVVLYSRLGDDAGFDPFDPDFDLASIDPATPFADGVMTDPNLDAFKAKVEGSDLLRGLRDGEFADNLSLPILTDGFQSIGMLFGRNAVLVDYGLPPLGVEFEYLQVFPVWGPLAVSIEISFGFTVDLHSVGYDTFGLQRYADGGYRNPAVIFDGFYLNDLDAEGVDAPEVTFEFGLVGAAELNLGIARAGVGGGIDAIINFNWYDPINDGRVHISELFANVETAIPGPNPLAVFDVSGALTFQLFAFLEIKLLGIEEEFPITPETELFSFNESFEHEQILGTEVKDGVLMLNIGPSSEDRIYGDISDGSEKITVHATGNTVTIEGYSKTFTNITHIIGIGGQGNDIIELFLDADSTFTYELEGGIGDDTITVSGGTGRGTIVGGVGNDSLTGGDGNDVITGGEGNDTIYGSGGDDILFGDQGRVVDSAYADSPYLTSRVTLADGADEIHGGAGDDVAIGAGGDDKLYGDAGGDILIGDGGRFEFEWSKDGVGNDIVGQIDFTSLRPTSFDAPDIVTNDPMPPQEISDAIDDIYGGIVANFHATDLFYGGNDVIEGGADGDMIFGGSGDDLLKGDGGEDFILAGKGFDEVFGGDDADHIFGNDQADIISGDAGNDVVSGGSGNDYIHGNDGNDVLKGDSGADVIFGDANDDQLFGQTEPDILFGGTGNDLVVGGTSNDIMFGDDGLVAKLGTSAKIVYNDLVIDGTILNMLLASVTAAEGAFQDGDIRTVDLILTYVAAGDGNDIMSGDAADDIMLGGGGNDLMGGDVDPRLPDAGGPTDISEDVLIGDGGMITFDLRRFRSIATVIDPVGAVEPVANDKFDDTIYGDNGNDYIFGGWGSDFLFGGHGKVVDLTADPGAEVGGSRGVTDDGASDNDIILGDNGEIRFADDTIEANFGIKELIRTTDESNSTGGHEYVEGELGADVIFGGVNASVDVLFGNAGSDVILGDNGELDFAYGTDTDLDTLDLIRSNRDGLGGEDWISGNQGGDVLVGGTGGDLMYGDDANASSGSADGEDIMLGDNADIWMMGSDGRLEVQVAEMTTGTAVYLITTTDVIDVDHPTKEDAEKCGGADTMSGNAGNDIMLGGVNNDDGILLNGIEKDRMYGDRAAPDSTTIANDGDDILLGDNGLLSFSFDPIVLAAEDEAETSLLADVTFNVAINYDPAVAVTVDAGNYGNFDGLLVAVNAALETAGLDNLIVAEAADGSIALRAIDPSVAKISVTALAGNKLGFGTKQKAESGSGSQVLDLIRSFEDGLGGADIISGNKGLDVAIGGTGGDTIYGDDATASAAAADLADLLLGDNADIFLVAKGSASGGDLKVVLDAAVKTIRTTDTLDPINTGGSDTISGNAKGDIIAGGVYGDTLYGDRLDPTTAGGKNTTLLDGDDIILGDNGAFEWLSTGRLDEITGIDIAANNAALWTKYGTGTADTDLGTLDLVTTEQPTSGGRDTIYGDQGRDFVFGGTDADTIYGDDGNETGDAGNNDLLFGDHGRLYPQFSTLRDGDQYWSDDFNSRNFFAIDVGDSSLLISAGGEGDIIRGEEGDDAMLGQQGDDRMWGGSGNDDMTGGHNVAGGWDELSAPAITVTLGQPVNDLMDGGSGDDSMAGDNAIIWRRGDDLSPRFRELTALSIYTTTADTIVANIGGTWQSDPADAIGRDIQLVDHSDAVQTTPDGRYGNDVMAGGADSDTMFGELGNDLMQGDGAIATTAVGSPFISRTIAVVDSGSNPDTDQTLYFNIPELASDGDDYLEGNGGSDLMYGGLGQDDMIGGSSALFGLDDVNAALLGYVGEQLRPDTFDYLYGGAGIATARNDIGATTFGLANEDGTTHVITTTATGHARDADYIMGDNANVYRLVIPATDAFHTFNYDNYGTLKIIPRAMEQLDYTLGGADYNDGDYIDGAAQLTGQPADNGGADLIHGESGDDIIFGMTGSDVIFGEGQDDDIVGGYGQDWISGGTGQDGILGDDGLIRTSRNSTAGEPLNAIAGLLASDPEPKYANGNVLNEVIRTPGDIQYAVINLTGELKKTADLVPFSYDPLWTAMDDEFPDNMDDSPFADDIIFGGLGSDWLHGGSGDDAISGAEALTHAYVPVYDVDGNPTGVLDLGYAAVDLPANAIIPGVTQVMAIPGDVLAYNKVDTDGQHLNNRFRAGEFDLYDEYDPRRTVQLDASGNLWKPTSQGTTYEFLLNFDESEGVLRAAGTVPKATGQQTENYPAVRDDGKDAIFGDLGNDWLVGGTGRDNLYGGWGNDLLNADDDHDGHLDTNQLNDFTDTHPYYEDRAYGGAGRDILIGNTGGDRLIDWVGEYNSYLVPYAPFGQASVSRTLQPFLPEFLYSLSAGDGADPTRAGDTGASALRNGEPDAEMGLVLQKDFAWQDQTGAPADPQAGNIPGGPRDVLRSASFNDDNTQGFAIDSGKWSLQSGVLYVEPTKIGTNALAVWNHDQVLPSYFELTATITPVKPIAGYKANAYIVFDYYSADDFKFAGINTSTNKIEVGRYTAAGGWQVLASTNMTIKAGTSYNLLVALNGTSATIVVDNKLSVSYTFTPRVDQYGITHKFNDGMIGLGANSAKASIDNVTLRVLPPTITLTRTDDFSVTPALLAGESGTWTLSNGYYVGTPAAGETLALAQGSLTVGANYQLQIDTKIATTATGGIVFDQYAADDFKWAAWSKATNQILLGHYTADGGWVVDTAVSRTLSGDVTLSVILKGCTVKVLVNGSVAITYSYNAVVTDGGFGLLAKGGTASFDSFTVKTDDPAFAAAKTATLLAAEAPAGPATGATLSEAELAAVIDAAKARWLASGLLDEEAAALLNGVSVQIGDLDGLVLGDTSGDVITIDSDAAGYGWFIDPTPGKDTEFSGHFGALTAIRGGDAWGEMDLLTVLNHELGHLLGLEHDGAGLMAGTLAAGVRILPTTTSSPAAAEPAPVQPAGLADMPWSATPGIGPQTGAEHSRSPVIDWQASYLGGGERNLPPAGARPDWVENFVKRAGKGAAEFNPNASLRVTIPANERGLPTAGRR